VKWKEAKAALAKQAPERSRNSVPQVILPLLKLSGPVPLPSRWTWARVESRRPRGRVVKVTTTPPNNPHPKPPPQPVTEALGKSIVTATRKTARPKQPEPKSTAAPTKRASGKSKKKAAASVKTAAATPTTPSLVVPTQNPTSPLEEISDLLDHLPIHSCVELNRGSSRPSLPSPQEQLALALSLRPSFFL